MRVAIIGCGLIGQKRARALAGCRLVACADAVREKAEALAALSPGVQPLSSWQAVVERPDVDIVVIAATHDVLAEITSAAIAEGKHVLVEKPAARRAAELDALIQAAHRHNVLLRVGFNHRYHPAFRNAWNLYHKGRIEDGVYVRWL